MCLVTPSALGVGLCTPDAMEHFPRFHSQHTALCSRLSGLAIITMDMPTLPLGGLRRPPLLATCSPPYLCLLEEDWPATMPVITTQDYPSAHKDP
ncbi:hypothetical protein E2C01_044400 [Portunus trituberculatus]|uniref:Uncharacterized protein n=1 Tax=Portunus trituberculatus TaxID=210409 RepID=A0A5B7FT12_PORTR|nr:hypothetical protein [Portunus trituberculatus]